MALRPDEARELIEVAARHGVRLACAPATFLGEAQQTAAAWIRDGRPGTDPRRLRGREPRADRDLAPGAAGVLRRRRAGRRRRLPADAGHDDGRAGAVRAGVGLGPAAGPGDGRRDAVPHRPPRPDRRRRRARRRGGAAADGLVLRRPAGQVPRRPRVPRRPWARSRWATSRSSTPRSRSGPYDGDYAAVPWVREPFAGIDWGRGVADLAAAIAEDRPHRASAEQAAHVVDILDAAARSMADAGRPVEVASSFPSPALMPWAVIRD